MRTKPGAAPKMPTPSKKKTCTNQNEILKKGNSSWDCQPDLDSFGSLSCDEGEIPGWDGTEWSCQGSGWQKVHLSLSRHALSSECEERGWVVESGYDDGSDGGTAGDGKLQSGEVTERRYRCGMQHKTTA